MARKASSKKEVWTVINPHAAGLDIGAREIWACVPADRDETPVRCFGTFTPDLEALAAWLVACGVTTVAMESTGVYWIPIYELLEERSVQARLVNARHIKNVPGRKSDVQDNQWIQRLHSYGLLSASFRPEAEMVVLRSYLRHRAMLIEHRAAHIQHMQKALHQMNVQLTQTGHYRAEHVFALKQALALYDAYTAQLVECDHQIEQQYSAFKPLFDPDDPAAPLGPDLKVNSHSKNAPDFDVRRQLFRLTGIDLTQVDGLDDSSVQQLLAETGTDMSKWRTVKHFASWLGLAPHNDITGGRVVRSRTLKNHNRAGQVLRLAAQSVGRGKSALGAYFRRMRARLGTEQATTATAHKLARIIYHMLKEHQPYRPQSATAYDQQQRQRELKRLQRQAANLGFMLQPRPN